MTKEQLSKLATLNNLKTNKFLEDFAKSLQLKIEAAKSNEDIISDIDLLHAIYYRADGVVIQIIKYLIYEAKPLPEIKKEVLGGKLPGDTHNDVLIKILDLTRSVRYYSLEDSIKIAFDLSKSENNAVASSALKLIEDIVEYNYQALPQIGIFAQIKAMDFVEEKIPADLQKNSIPFIKIVIQHLLETSSHAAIMSSPDTLTMSSGDIIGNVNIAKLRRRAIVFSVNLFKKADSVEDKNSLFTNIQQASQMPMNSARDSELGMIIQEDRKFILEELRGIVLSENKVIQPLSVCLQVDHWLNWYFLHIELQQELALSFLKVIYADPRYKVFAAFIHDDSYRLGKIDYKAIKDESQINIEQYIEKVTGVLDFEELEDIANEAKHVDEWKIATFKKLLEELSLKKPDIGVALAKKAIRKKTAVVDMRFLPLLLTGLRRAGRFDLWDEIYSLVVDLKEQDLVIALIGSMYVTYNEPPEINIRKKDITIVANIIAKKNLFAFLEKEKPNNLLRHFSINVLRNINTIDPKKTEKLVILEIKKNLDYLPAYLNTLSVYFKEDAYGIRKWTKSSKNFLLNQIISIDNVDWHIQWLLISLCDTSEDVVKFFLKRINYRQKKYSDEDFFSSERRNYDAVPYDFNHELVEFVQKNYKESVDLIVENLSSEYSVKSIEISSLIKNLNIRQEDILGTLSKEGEINDKTLKKIVGSLSNIDNNDPDFLVELASKTSNKRLHERIYGRLASTGVVSGEFGIADAYKHKIQALEKYKNSENKNIKKFVNMCIEWLTSSEDRARKSAEAEIEMRRIDFEANK